jgi:lipoate-protein ligase B
MSLKSPCIFSLRRQSISLYSTKQQAAIFPCKIENQELIHYHIKNKYADYTKISNFQTSLLNQYLNWYKKYPIFKLNELKVTNVEEFKSIMKTKPKPSIISVEFNPIFTAGKKFMKTIQNPDEYSKPYREFVPPSKTMVDKNLGETLDCKLPEFQFINRGGKITYHGPGQLVIYFIIDLKDFSNLDIRKYIQILERNIKEYVKSEGLDVVNYKDEVGVFVKRKSNNCTYKISSIGINLQKLVTTHGISINIQNNLDYLNTFEMCGLENLQQTSLINEKKTINDDISTIAKKIVTKINHDLGDMNIIYKSINEDEINL